MNPSTKDNKAPASFDPSFGTQGIVRIQLASESFYGTSRLLPDGKILSVGSILSSDMLVIVRHTTDGVLDDTFGNQGVVHTRLPENYNATLLNFVVQSNGKIIVFAGIGNGLNPFGAALFARLLPDGRLDLIFGTSGMTSFNIQLDSGRRRTGMAVQPDGKVFVAAETADIGAGRGGVIFGLSANGQPDVTFGNNGLVYGMEGATFQSLTLQGDKILVGGIYQRGGLIARYTDKGELDLSYGSFNQGFVLIDSTGGVHVELIHLSQQPDGKTLAAGYIFKGENGALIGALPLLSRVNSDGKEDGTFNGGKALEIFVNGELDYGWQALCATVQADEKIVVLCQPPGSTRSALLRYIKDGTPDADFGTQELQIISSQPSPVVQVQPDNKILISGSTDGTGIIARLLG
ncbi:hypothetical protein [Pseudomonas gingeri]|uniref:Delta-60 repeat domain-containing protein n=1 Tax=Pseudomonas gingeri TaxID=117681 RepID=A0A7Y7WPP3_9PSED|nr:hypothetical protein [Pseudomonas gingeri]NWB84402.1 hypothetical protein [Pseudomonas gingeri]